MCYGASIKHDAPNNQGITKKIIKKFIKPIDILGYWCYDDTIEREKINQEAQK